jgi:hypothetical protein
MIASPPSRTSYLRNDRMKAERDRQMAATMQKLRRLSVFVAVAIVFAIGAFFYNGCSFSNGCSTTPMAALQQDVVGDLVPGS